MSAKLSQLSLNRIIISLVLLALLFLGIWLRWRFIETVQLYPDEFVTLLAIQMIGEKGVPLMPSGLFYDHGLLFSYAGYLATFFGPPRLVVRTASLICGVLTMGLTFWLGRRWFSPAVGLIALAGLAIAPTAIHWSGRARMYALFQLLVLLTLWLLYEGFSRNRAGWRWAGLLAYLGTTLTQFAAVALAPPLVLAVGLLEWLGYTGQNRASIPHSWLARFRKYSLEILAFGAILIIAFLVKRLGQPRGIEPADASQPLAGVLQVLAIYSDFSGNIGAGWEAIAPFYLTLPALLYLPLALIATGHSLFILRKRYLGRAREVGLPPHPAGNANPHLPPFVTVLFLSLILWLTTVEMIFFVSAERRDDKYLFMLLPVLLLLGAQGLALTARSLLEAIYRWRGRVVPRQPRLASLWPILVSLGIVLLTWGRVQSLLANTGDDYDAAFAYLREHWQEGDKILTGTPAAAAFYLGHNDFYSVQRRGGYDYRILTVDDRPVDRWLASPAIRTEADLHQTLAGQRVWLLLERWGLQREYYDLPFQQQLLAQTEYITEAQGIFILRSKPAPHPLAVEPAQPLQPVRFTDPAGTTEWIQLSGYTVEPEQVRAGQPLRLTLYWQALAAMPEDYTVFVHLRQSQGGNVAQADHQPLGPLFPTSLWPPGETIRESSELVLPAGLPPGPYELWVGLYDLETGERLPVQQDMSGENAVRLGSLVVE